MFTLMVQIDAGHSWLAVALGFLFARARCNLLEAQDLWGDKTAQWRGCTPGDPGPPRHTSLTLITGAAQLAEVQMVPVLIVGVFRARGTNCVLITATFSRDLSAWNVSGAVGVSGDQGSTLTSATGCVTLGLSLSAPAHEGWPVSLTVSASWFSWEMVAPCLWRQRGGRSPLEPASLSQASSGQCLSPGGQREQQA